MQATEIDFVSTIAPATLFAIDHLISEPADMPARHPHLRVHDERAIDPHHRDLLPVRPRRRVAHHVLPPGGLDVVLQLNAERPVVPEAIDAAVDLAALEEEAA